MYPGKKTMSMSVRKLNHSNRLIVVELFANRDKAHVKLTENKAPLALGFRPKPKNGP